MTVTNMTGFFVRSARPETRGGEEKSDGEDVLVRNTPSIVAISPLLLSVRRNEAMKSVANAAELGPRTTNRLE